MLDGGVDAVIVETCQDLLQAKAAVLGAKRAMTATGIRGADPGPRHRGDHRHDAARHRDRRGADRAGAAGRRLDRAELRHRPGRDERAPALPVPARADRRVGDAERRPARAGARRRGLPADARRAGRGAVPVRPRVRARPGRRLLRHDARAHPAGRRGGARGRPGATRAAAGAGRLLALPPRAVRPGRLGADGRRADERQRLQGVPRGDAGRPVGGLHRDRPGAGPRRLAPARPVRRLRRPRRRSRHARAGRAFRHRLDAADHAGLDRAAGDRGRPGDARRPLHRQLGQLRGRRRAGVPLRPGDADRRRSTAPRWSR